MLLRACFVLVLHVIISGCRPARPTITGAELYARLPALRDTGETTVGAVLIRKNHVLTSGPVQVFVVEQVIEKCRGGDPAADVDCTLALLLDQRFTVMDHWPERKSVKAAPEDRSGSAMSSFVVIGFGVGAIAGLGYGAATCEFPGCEVVFGLPLVLVAGAVAFAFVN